MQERSRAFTLVEMVVAMGVMSLLMTGLAATLMLSSKAIPTATTPVGSMVQAERGLWDMAADLATLRTVPFRASTGVGIVVPDRDGDGMPDQILFTWSGVPGAPLTRSYNGGAAVTMINAVRELTFTYDLHDVSQATTPGPNESSEQILAQYNPATDLQDNSIDKNNWVGQYFMPTLPGNATSWKITKVSLRLKVNGGNDGMSHVQIRLPTIGNIPSTTIVDDLTIPENTLSASYNDMTYTFSKASGLSPTTGICIVLVSSVGGASCDCRSQNSGNSAANSNLVNTSNAGNNWNSFASKSMYFAVYGTITAPGQSSSVTAHYLRGIHIKLRAGTDQSPAVETTVRIANLPEIGG